MNGTYYEQPFLQHFLDAIVLCEMAGDLPALAISRHSSLARASIMAATFSIEAAANILMMPIKAPQRIIELVDKGQVLDKYEFVLMGVQPNEKLDRKTVRTQAVAELFSVRNKFVHPRSQKRTILSRDLDNGAFTAQKQDKATNILGLPSSPEDWTVHHALRVLQAAADFLDYFVIDLCKLENDLIRKLFLCTIETHGESGLVLTDEQKNIFHRAFAKFSIDFRMARLLVGPSDVLKTLSVKLLITYTWGLKSTQLHDQKKIIEVDGDEVTSKVIINAVQHFLVWFEEAEHNPYGRRLIFFEAWSTDGSERYANFKTFLTDWKKEAKSGTGKHRPIGIVPGTKAQLFFNAVLGVCRDKDELTLTVLLDTGKGRELKLNQEASMQFLQCVTLNRRNEWISEGVTNLITEIETKGKDYEVTKVHRIGYDPTSRTAIWTYKTRSGNLMQANMKPSTLIAISELLQTLF